MEITRHFTATVLIVHKNKVLLHRHKKFDTLLPVGGHLDRDELPEEAALREIVEETGLQVKLYNPDDTVFPDDSNFLPLFTFCVTNFGILSIRITSALTTICVKC